MKQPKTTPPGSMERMVRARTITLSENVRQESPVGFMVFAHNDMDADYMMFGEERDARDYSMEQEEKANAPEDSWPIYALWASEWNGELTKVISADITAELEKENMNGRQIYALRMAANIIKQLDIDLSKLGKGRNLSNVPGFEGQDFAGALIGMASNAENLNAPEPEDTQTLRGFVPPNEKGQR